VNHFLHLTAGLTDRHMANRLASHTILRHDRYDAESEPSAVPLKPCSGRLSRPEVFVSYSHLRV
jgi:hypothetical protein